MIYYLWKYRYFQLAVIFLSLLACVLSFDKLNIFFDSERIIELSNVEPDIIDKSIDDKNLLLVGLKFSKPLSYENFLRIYSLSNQINNHASIHSVRSVFNERIYLNSLVIPFPVKALDLSTKHSFNDSKQKILKYESHYVTSDFRNLLFVIKCKNLHAEDDKISLLAYLEDSFSVIDLAEVKISGQIKSELYMQEKIVNELVFFTLLSLILCSIVLWYFTSNLGLVLINLFSVVLSLIFSFTLSNILFGGIELVMIIIPAIVFIITVSDFMHLLNVSKLPNNKYEFFNKQVSRVGKPVFITSITTAIGFLSFSFSSIEPLMRFGLITTLSIFISLFLIINLFSFSVDMNLVREDTNRKRINKLISKITYLSKYRSIILCAFVLFSIIGVSSIKINNFLTDEINHKSDLYKDLNYFDSYFDGIKPISFSLNTSDIGRSYDIDNFIEQISSNGINIDFMSNKMNAILPGSDKDNILIKARMKDIGSLESNIIYNKIEAYSVQNNLNSSIGGIGYLFDKISNKLTLEILISLLMAVIVIGLLFVIINQFNFNYFFVSLLPNLIPLFSCLGMLSLFGFYFSLSNAFIFAIVFGLIVDDSIHIISSYSVSRKRNLSINQSINYCREKTFQALIKTTIVIIVALIPLLFSEFKSISQLASITIITAVIAIIFDILFLPWLLVRFIK